MRTIFEACEPRQDVLSGNLPESQFAADLRAVARGEAPELYREPQVFFQYTFLTEDLRHLVQQVLGRFAGLPGTNPCLRLETSFGGGKTHSLIALWHLARKPVLAAAFLTGVIDPGLLPREPLDVVALVGDKYGPEAVDQHDGVITRTLWGEMAWQLGRYEILAELDQARLTPSEAQLEALCRGRQVLVLLDELPAYLRTTRARVVGGSTLADQTLQFFRMLLGYAASHEHFVVVYTLSERRDPYGREREEIEQLAEARAISARVEKVMRPIREQEIAAVLRRRLFLSVDMEAASEVARAYVEHLHRIRAQGAPLPPEVDEPSYEERLRASYPFHPELLDTLYRKTCTFPGFQWARGALRILAAAVQRLWKERPADAYLIQSTDLDLSHPAIREELTSRIDRPRLVTAIAEDIWSEHGNANAQVYESDWTAKGLPGLLRRVAQAVFLHSLVYTGTAGEPGAEPAEVHLACARPGLPFEAVDQALAQLDEKFYYVEFDGRRYVFRDEPTITKLIQIETANVGLIAAKEAARQKARELFSGPIFELIDFPMGPEGVPDKQARPLLVLIDFDHVALPPGDAVPASIQEIFEYTGERREYRHYQNHLVVLVADAGKKEAMIEAARRALALERLMNEGAQRYKLTGEAQRKLREQADEAQLRYRVAVTNAYCHLFYRAPGDGRIARLELPAQDSADVRRPAQQVIRDALVQVRKVLTHPLAPDWILDRIWPEGGAGGEAELSLAELLERFYRRPKAYMVLDHEGLHGLRQTVRRGVEEGFWVYVDRGRVYRAGNPPTAEDVRFDKEALLLTPALAEKRHPPAPVPEPVSVAPSDGEQERKPEDWEGLRPQPPVQPQEQWVEADGPAPKALAAVRDQLADRGVDGIVALHLSVADPETALRLLEGWSAVTNALDGAGLQVVCELATGDGVELHFRGPERAFAALIRGVRTLLQEAKGEPMAALAMQATFPEPRPWNDDRFDQLARDLEETYRCRSVGVRAVWRPR